MTTKQKQRQLYFLGYYGGEIDGNFGTKSKAATEKFQKDNGLDADGIFGSKTKAMSKAVIKKIQKAIGMPTKQQDGLAGKKTEAATKVFQAACGLVANGIAGPLTQEKIVECESINWDEVKYFTRDEFKCKCGGKYCHGFPAEPNKKLISVCERTREHFSCVMKVNSGVRCQTYNDSLDGSVPNSRHIQGKAVDFKLRTSKGGYLGSKKLLEFVQNQPEIRYAYAINNSSVHMDIE